ncbi:MAG: DeoR family transcriptional regulator [Candidatus Melainabacteria bacterium]|jgi:predicted ArsR family transcriptional regulator|nr:DeoR family transcriptional regulator [Candidatus Melainabacteria bacterium]
MITQPLSDTPETTQQAVLLYLKRHGEMTIGELCDLLDITSMAVRRHISGLMQDGLVLSRMVKQSRGRPTYKYSLTQKAESLFPSGMQTLAVELLDMVFEESGHKGVMQLLKRRNEKRASRLLPRVEGKSLEERVVEVAKIFSEDGYMTEWEKLPDGNFFIFQRHCALHDLANKYRQLCALEPQLMETLLGVRVTREKYMLQNDPVCGYLVKQAG